MEEVCSQLKVEHAGHLLQGVKRLWKEAFIPDFKLLVEDEWIQVHRAVLAATSPYFWSLFSRDDYKESKQGHVHLQEVTYQAVFQSIQFAYTGTADVNLDNVSEIVNAAAILQLNSLSQLCFEYLKFSLSVESWLLTKDLADLYDNNELKDIVEQFAIRNFEAIISYGVVKFLKKEDLKLYLKASNVGHELSWKAVTDWIPEPPEERKTELFSLLECLNLEEFSSEYLFNSVISHQLVISSALARDYASSFLFQDKQKLRSILTLENCFSLNTMIRENQSLREKAGEVVRQFLAENFDSLTDNDSYKELALEEVKALCGFDDKRRFSEEMKWRLIVGWVKHRHERKAHFPELFQLIQLPELAANFLQKTVSCEELVREFPICRNRLHAYLRRLSSIEMETPNMEATILLLDKGYINALQFSDGLKEKRRLPAPPRHRNPDQRIVSAWAQLYFINGRDIFVLLQGSDRWVKQGTLEQPINHDTKVVSTKEAIYFVNGSSSTVKLSQEDPSVPECSSGEGFDASPTGEYTANLSLPKLEEDSSINGCLLGEGFCAAATHECLFAMGGLATSKEAKFYRFAPKLPLKSFQLKKWKRIPDMKQERMDASAACMEDRVYVIGGVHAGRIHMTVEFYSEGKKSWTLVANMRSFRCRLATCVIGRKIFAIAGDHDKYADACPATIESYNCDSNKWQTETSHLAVQGRIFACEMPTELVDQVFDGGNDCNKDVTKLFVSKKRVIKRLKGGKIIFQENTCQKKASVDISISPKPDDLPEVWEPITPYFCCATGVTFDQPALLELSSGFSGNRNCSFTVLERFPEGQWEPVGVTGLVDNKVMVNITGSCQLVAAILKAGCTSPCVEKSASERSHVKVFSKTKLPDDSAGNTGGFVQWDSSPKITRKKTSELTASVQPQGDLGSVGDELQIKSTSDVVLAMDSEIVARLNSKALEKVGFAKEEATNFKSAEGSNLERKNAMDLHMAEEQADTFQKTATPTASRAMLAYTADEHRSTASNMVVNKHLKCDKLQTETLEGESEEFDATRESHSEKPQKQRMQEFRKDCITEEENGKLTDRGQRADLSVNLSSEAQESLPVSQVPVNIKREHADFQAAYLERIKQKVETSDTIGPTGGTVQLLECSLKFPEDAMKKDRKISISLDNDPENFPPDVKTIALILGFKPSMTFDKPVEVTMRTWFRAKTRPNDTSNPFNTQE